MPPRIYLVRHAQGEHNATRNFTLPDPLLTAKGKSQCAALSSAFPHHSTIDLVLASPLKRTIQTAVLSFGPTLARPEVPFLLDPRLQEVSNAGCDTGTETAELKSGIEDLFAGDAVNVGVELGRIDFGALREGWNNNEGYYAYEKQALLRRAADVRASLFARSEEHILLVTHGAFAHFLTEDWDVADPMTMTAYRNCEVRQFDFTPGSTASDAHVEETAESRGARGTRQTLEGEEDAHVVDELKGVEEGEEKGVGNGVENGV